MKVRALPTWRNPVGEGAKRTLGLLSEDEFIDSGIEDSDIKVRSVRERALTAIPGKDSVASGAIVERSIV